MKKFQEIADELGVSKQAVYKRYRNKLYKDVLPYVRVVCGTTYIMDEGENIIKQSFLRDGMFAKSHTERIQDTLILMLQKELEAKNRQIEEQANIIQELSKTIKTLTTPKPKRTKKPMKKGKTSPPIERHMEEKIKIK